jgi:hypothetical protein
MARPMAMTMATMPSMRSVDLTLAGLEVAGGLLGDGDVGHYPAGHRVAAMDELPREISFSSSRVRAAIVRAAIARGHIAEAWRNSIIAAPSSIAPLAFLVPTSNSCPVARHERWT